jgi:hypothetical protein
MHILVNLTNYVTHPFLLKRLMGKDGSHMAGGTDHDWGHADLGLKNLGLEKAGTESVSTLNGKIVNKAR